MSALKLEESQILEINGYILSIRHNEQEISIDIYKDEEILIEDQYWFEDLEQISGEEQVINES